MSERSRTLSAGAGRPLSGWDLACAAAMLAVAVGVTRESWMDNLRAGIRPCRPLCGGEVLECTRCGLVFFSSVPCTTSPSAGPCSIQTDDGYTRAMIERRNSRPITERFRRMAEQRHEVYSRRLGRSRYRLLEVGCGTADLGVHFANMGVQYHGIDIDGRCVETAQHESPSVTVEQTDFFDLPESDRFDVICSSQVVEHILDPRRFVENVYRHLTPGGVVHCDVPNHSSLAGTVSRLGLLRKPTRWGGR